MTIRAPRASASLSASAGADSPAGHDSRDASAEEPIVRLVDLHKSFGRQPVLRGVSMDIRRGSVTVVLGPSGCGKSVTLKHIVGLLRPDAGPHGGEVWFDGCRIDRLRESDLVPVRRQIGFLFQQSALFDSMSVRDNVAFPLAEHSPMGSAARNERVREVLEMVGLGGMEERMPGDLSGGQRKRAALARALALEPRLMLYDEPTTGLDPIRSDVINELILRLQRRLHMTSIVVTHDLVSAFKVADHMIMLYDGRVMLEGTPQHFRETTDPVVQRFLRGEAGADELAGIASALADSGADSGADGESRGEPGAAHRNAP